MNEMAIGKPASVTLDCLDPEEPPKQVRLDLAVDDLDGAQRAAIGLGATKANHQPSRDRRRVLLDPAGHPFCAAKMS
jgi:hypothetical protein